ncbi:hypothetical protein ON010_g7028 [Phytophthora cinnamomi]|nr:hypothetical protein ON010_g7028 [Phytophthora cinnamomi]
MRNLPTTPTCPTVKQSDHTVIKGITTLTTAGLREPFKRVSSLDDGRSSEFGPKPITRDKRGLVEVGVENTTDVECDVAETVQDEEVSIHSGRQPENRGRRLTQQLLSLSIGLNSEVREHDAVLSLTMANSETVVVPKPTPKLTISIEGMEPYTAEFLVLPVPEESIARRRRDRKTSGIWRAEIQSRRIKRASGHFVWALYVTVFKQKSISRRIAWWCDEPAEIQFQIRYIKGVINTVADGISRRPEFMGGNELVTSAARSTRQQVRQRVDAPLSAAGTESVRRYDEDDTTKALLRLLDPRCNSRLIE